MRERYLVFSGVGVLGFLVQAITLAILSAAGWPLAAATVVAVELAVLHNFWWHERLTWRDRAALPSAGQSPAALAIARSEGEAPERTCTGHGMEAAGPGSVRSDAIRYGDGATWRRLARFQLTTGITSIVVNTALTTALAHLFELDPLVANTGAVLIASVVNFVVADRLVFQRRDSSHLGRGSTRHAGDVIPAIDRARRELSARVHRTATLPRVSAACSTVQRRAVCLVGFALSTLSTPAVGSVQASPLPETVDAWNAYVRDAEAQMAARPLTACSPGHEPRGETQGVSGGTIHRWIGCTVVRSTTVDSLLQALRHPGTPPPQEEILESRVLARRQDGLHVYLKLRRQAVVTVTYDTEHDVAFNRHSAIAATSTSVATSIAETGGGDRGFLWRLNSYWRYVQVGRDVRVELESLSLSRPVPRLLRPIAAPIVSSVARESVTRALEALRSYARAD